MTATTSPTTTASIHASAPLGEFVEFTRAAEQRGIRVIIDLVVNHTSIDHPWFQEARKNPSSKYRDWYVWSKKRPRDWNKGMVFPGVQKSTWSFDDAAQRWYLHRFYEFQPDLNTANPEVQQEIRRIMGYWIALGVNGFRMDAVPFMIADKGPNLAHPRAHYDRLRELRELVSWRRGDAIMLAEANITPAVDMQYFGDEGERLPMMFNFHVNQHLFWALASGHAAPLARALEATRDRPATAQWAHFLRNNDEVDLGRLPKAAREKCFAEFGPDKDMQLYDRGIRRRLAPMLKGDRRRLELAYSLLFTLPGTPVIRYGDELGMGDDLSLPERNAIRTPMQWSNEPERRLLVPRRQDRPARHLRRAVQLRARQRGRPAPRRAVAAQLDRAHHPHAQRVSRDRLGRLRGDADGRAERAGAALRVAQQRRLGRAQLRRRVGRGRAAREGRAGQPALVRRLQAGARRPPRRRARALRLSVVPRRRLSYLTRRRDY